MSVASRLLAATRKLRHEVGQLSFDEPVTHVYNPLDYAVRPHSAYVRRFANSRKRVVFLGMNPGPFGMAQTGVPFGEVSLVRDWLGIEAPVYRPENENPKRPIEGFACTRSEVSGARLWGAVRDRYGAPDRFFARHFIANYCPLVFMEAGGKNRTPDKLPGTERDPLFAACDAFTLRMVKILEPDWMIGVGAFAAQRAREALGQTGVRVGQILHPSPANPRANRGWTREVQQQLQALGLCDEAH